LTIDNVGDVFFFRTRCTVKQSQSPKSARRPAAKLSTAFYLYSLNGVTCLALITPYRVEIANFIYPPPFHYVSAFVRSDPLRIHVKALRFLKLESSRQPTVKIWWS